MKKIIPCFLLFLISCKPKAEFYLSGIPCYTKEVCVKDTSYYKYEWHYGYSYRGKYEYYFGSHYITECLTSKIDTIFIEQ